MKKRRTIRKEPYGGFSIGTGYKTRIHYATKPEARKGFDSLYKKKKKMF